MEPKIEIFLEKDYEEETEARAARDQRKQELEQQGLICLAQDCISVVSGWMVYLLQVVPEETPAGERSPRPRAGRSRSRAGAG
ncbi:hypothetical protein [Candidatus Cyanaurora vandensis]|uniref:hypothetical protein n=1 Tax=Candidatus Cyanaurora vandensis TaxID=2714958 RepID=UPI00258023D4|nr:hypothetical protein [Candidatus Cyanaurora vandensis]